MPFIKLLKSDKKLLCAVILGFIFIFSFICFLAGFKVRRYYFTFEEAGSARKIVEVRKIPSEKYRTKLECYVEELILGPSVQRAVPVFPVGTKVLFCHENNRIVYINISEEAVTGLTAVDVEKEDEYKKKYGKTVLQVRYEQLRENIKKNFSDVKEVNLFIDGNFSFGQVIPRS